MAENFDLIFGQNASQQYAWSDNDYQKGWETIGNIPPTAAQFDALQRRSDTKLKELNDELTPLVNADTADSRQPSTTYSEGDIKYSPLLPTGWFLTCTTAGTTSASELVLPTPIAGGDTVTDGEVVWTIRKINSMADIPIATEETNGLMSAADKTKLNGIANNANNYSLPAATGSTRGGVKIGSNISLSGDTISLAKANVTNALGYTPPTTNTTYSTGTASYSGTTKLYTGIGDNTDGTMTQKAIKAIVGSSVPLGAILPLAHNSTVPSGYLLCDGAAVSRTMYPDLFSVIGTTYGAGDGSTTFNVPDYNTAKRFVQGDTVAGTIKQAGLPNITGSVKDAGTFETTWGDVLPISSFDGAITPYSNSVYRDQCDGTSSKTGCSGLKIDASLSSSIYGASDTVQPPALTARYIIKAFDGQTPDSALIDVTQYAQELATKANRQLSNLTQAGQDSFLERDFAIIYPNGGSEASPANLTKGSRYVESNPFPGYRINCVAEIKLNNQWCDSGFIFSDGGGYGVKATHLMPDDNVIVQVGNNAITTTSPHSGNGFNNTITLATAPCRVKVWKIGKIPTA